MKRTLRRMILLLMIAPLILLGGCSKIRFAYNQLDWFLKGRADAYFDFNDAQEKAFKADLDAYLSWHRRVMLPQYASHLRRSATYFSKKPLERKEYDTLSVNFEKLIRETLVPALPMLTGAAKRMSPKQIKHFAEELKDGDESLRERVSGDAGERADKMTANLTRMFTLFFVRLSYDQKIFARKFLKENAGSPEPWLADRKLWRTKIVGMLNEGVSREQLEAHLKMWILEPEKIRSPEYHQQFLKFQKNMQNLLYELVDRMSDKQRAEFVERLLDHATSFEILSKEGVPQLKPAPAKT